MTLAFGLMALALSVFLACATWVLVIAATCHQQRETAAGVETADNASGAAGRFSARHCPCSRLLGSLPQTARRGRRRCLIAPDGHWYSDASRRSAGPRSPAGLARADRRPGAAGTSSRGSRFEGRPYRCRGRRSRWHDPGTAFFELFPLDDVDRTFRVAWRRAGRRRRSPPRCSGWRVGRFASRRRCGR